MKLNSPVRIVPTHQVGFHVSGWKSNKQKEKEIINII